MKTKALSVVAALAACVSLAQSGREISVSRVSDAALRVGLAPSGSEGALWVAFGATDGGSATNGWANVRRVADLPASACEVDYSMPADWLTSDVLYRFFVFSDETDRYSSYLVDSVTSPNGKLHVDTEVRINGTTMLETRVRIVMTPHDTTWPVCGIANPEPYFFLGRGEGGRIFYGGGVAENVDCGVYVDLNRKSSFDLDFKEGTYQVFNLESDPPTTLLNATDIRRQNTTGDNTFWLFGYNGERAQRKMTIFSAEMWQFGELVADMAPAVSNGVACLWDNVRQRYFLPVDAFGNAAILTPGATRCAPDVSSTETYSSQAAGGPELANVTVSTEGGILVLKGRILQCGAGCSTCTVSVKYGQDAAALTHVVGEDVSAGQVSVPLNFLAPGRTYQVVLRIENEKGESSESDTIEVSVPEPGAGSAGSRALRVKSVDLAAGKAVLFLDAGVAGTLTVLAGNAVAGDDPSAWPFVGEAVAVDGSAQDIEVTLPTDPATERTYRVVRFVLASPQSDLYGHLVDTMTSVTESRFVDTGVMITPQNYMTSRMRITFKLTEGGKWNVNGWSDGNGVGRYFVGVSAEGWLSYGLGGYQDGDVPYSYGNVVTMDLDARDMTCTAYDETAGRMVKEWTMINSAPTGNLPLRIHGWNEGSRKQVIYRAQYWQGENLICDLLPCVDKDGVGCYYDAAANRLVYSTGSGTELQPGAEVKEQTGYLFCLPDSEGAPRLVRMEVTDGDLRGNTVTISGAVAQEGSDPVTSVELSVVLTRGGESEVRVLGNPDADGRFAFDVTDLEPGERYDWRLTASSTGGTDTLQGAAFATRKATYLQSATVRAEQYRVIGDVYAKFGPGATDLWVEWTVSETETNRLAVGTFTAIDDPHQAFEINLQGGVADGSPFAYCVVASNDLGEVYALSSISGSLHIVDQANYTWKPGTSGRWTDLNSWTCDKADRWDYPNGDHCGVVFGGAANVEVDGVVRAARLSFSGEELDVRFHAANTNDYSFTYVLDDELEIPDGGRVTIDGACVNWEEPLADRYAFALGESASLVVTNGAHFTVRYLKAYEEGSRIVICDGSSVGVQDFSLGNGELVIDDSFAACQALFVNNEINRHDDARLLIRGRNPQLRWRLYEHRTLALVAANASVCRMGQIDFEIPSGGYAATPVDCSASYEKYPFGDCDKLFTPGRTTNLTVRVVNAKADYASIPKRQELIRWSPSGIMKSRLDLVEPAQKRARFAYSDETDFPQSLDLVNDRTIGTMILVQ